jgi:polyisoprenoid-binding protein YceI
MMSTQTDVAGTSPVVPPRKWIVDPAHSNAEFGVKHIGIATGRGRFDKFEGTLAVAEHRDKVTIWLAISAIKQS